LGENLGLELNRILKKKKQWPHSALLKLIKLKSQTKKLKYNKYFKNKAQTKKEGLEMLFKNTNILCRYVPLNPTGLL